MRSGRALKKLGAGVAAALAIASEPRAARAEAAAPAEWRLDATAGSSVYFEDAPFSDGDLTGFFDKYRWIETESDDPGWFLDFTHFDLGLMREDGTHAARFERWAPGWNNARSRLGADLRGVDLEIETQRFEWSELRMFPDDTRGVFPTAADAPAVQFNPDTDPEDPLGRGNTFGVKRDRVGGTLSFRPSELGFADRGAKEIALSGWFEERDGHRQDRFLLDDPRELGSAGAQQRERFRGQRRDLDQEVAGGEIKLVLEPLELFTAQLRGGFERFSEQAPINTLGELADDDPGLGTGFTPEARSRPLFFVPDTDRWTGSLSLARKLGPANLEAGGSIAALEQRGRRSPLQRGQNLDTPSVVTGTAHGAVDVDLTSRWSAGASIKSTWRENHFDRSGLERAAPPGGQVDAFLRGRQENEASAELRFRPAAGAEVASGVRSLLVDRDLDYAGDAGSLTPESDLQDQRSARYTGYVRGRARLLRRARIEAEVGVERAPETGFPRELERAVYAEGRASYGWVKRVPGSASLFGRVRTGDSNEFRVHGESDDVSRTKEFDETSWRLGVALQAQPLEPLGATSTFVIQRDAAAFPHLRSTIPRYSGPEGLAFYRDSNLDYTSKLRTWMTALRYRPLEALELSTSASVSWLDAGYGEGSRTERVIEEVSRIDARITSLDARAEYALRSDVSFGAGYRFDRYDDHADVDPLHLDTSVHTGSVWVTYRIGPQP